MPAHSSPAPGPLAFTESARTVLRPVHDAHITGGLWRDRRAVNAATSIPDGFDRLTEAGNLHNLRLAAGLSEGDYIGDLPFLDSDVHKWLEAAAWQLGDPDTSPAAARHLTDLIGRCTDLLAAAQEPDGYLDSYYQVARPGLRFVELAWGHELYCAGHLLQAAVAHVRTTGRTDLLDVARRLADRVDASFGTGDGRIDGVCGHPEIETALVELYRATGERRYLDRARWFVDRRGHGLLPDGRFGARYWQDHVPLREARAVAGHAVRQLYLLAGAVDVYSETGDRSLLDAVERLWEDMAATKTFLTGGVGSHHTDEAFGDPYELPSERAYTETCAAIASVMLSWRLLLATGRVRYADHLERVLFNGFLSGVSLDGRSYVYVNPLQVRDGHVRDGGDHGAFRTHWFRCACCPPNVMRLLASLPHYMAAADGDSGLVLHQYATGGYAHGGLAVDVTTEYPWRGRIEVEVTGAPDAERALVLRIPQWAAGRWSARCADKPVAQDSAEDGWLRLRRHWRAGERVVLDLELAPRLTVPPARADALRGCVALERGPLVYCSERTDQPPGTLLDTLHLDPAHPVTEREQPGLLGGVVTLHGTGRAGAAYAAPTGVPDSSGTRRATAGPSPAAGAPDPASPSPTSGAWWPYADAAHVAEPEPAAEVPLMAIPYHVWAHREEGAMRVWLPLTPSPGAAGTPGTMGSPGAAGTPGTPATAGTPGAAGTQFLDRLSRAHLDQGTYRGHPYACRSPETPR